MTSRTSPIATASGVSASAVSPVPVFTSMTSSSSAQWLPFLPTALTVQRSEEHTSELQSRLHLVCRLLLEKKKKPSLTSLSSRYLRMYTTCYLYERLLV